MVEGEMLSWSFDSVVVLDGVVVRPLVERVDAVLVELMGGDVSAVVTRHHDQIGYFLGVYLVETNGLSKHAKGLLGKQLHTVVKCLLVLMYLGRRTTSGINRFRYKNT